MFDFGKANEIQKKAIQATDGPVLIIAGPGTGKTFTLVKRAIYLITEKNIAPEDILIATFTEKAAKELITRLSNELLDLNIEVNVNDLYIGTIHSICLRLIKEHLEFTRLKKNYRLIDDFEQKYLIYQHVKLFREISNSEIVIGDSASSWNTAENISYYVNSVAEELVDIDELSQSEDMGIKALSDIIKTYQAILKDENALDFSSIQCEAFDMLRNNSEICNELQEKIKYLMIDEYQDTNYVQEQLIMLLGDKYKNICVVGDDDQGLYRFRGATIRNILEFPQKFDNCQQFKLEENYRSEKDIINFYNDWMHNANGDHFEFAWDNYRFEKSIKASKDKFIEGQPTVLKISGNNGDIESWQLNILDFINKLKASGRLTDYNQIAFLFKSVKHPSVVALGNFLESHGVHIYSPRSDLFFERTEIKLTIGALMTMFPNFVTKLRDHKAYINGDMERYYTDCLLAFKEYLDSSKNEDLRKWCQLRAIDHLNPNQNFDYALSGLMYQLFQFEPFRTILDTDVSLGVVDSRPIRNLAIFTDLVTKYEYIHKINIFTAKYMDFVVERFFSLYLRFLIDGGISEYEDESDYAPKGCVSFMTIHQSKGLEFPIVIVGSLYGVPRSSNDAVISLLEEKYYHRKPYEPFDRIKMFDFWRLYYTAYSRAQNLLVLTATDKQGRGCDPSKYFTRVYAELPFYWDSAIDYKKYNFENVKEVNIKQSYAFTSNISVYENCSVQYKFYKELGFVAVRKGQSMFGTLVHQTIEDIHRAALRNECETITPCNVETWFGMNYDNLSRKEHTYLNEGVKSAALRQVQKYVETQGKDWSRIKAAEVEVSHVEPTYILTGKVDLIRGSDDTVEIIDFKAEKKPDMALENERITHYRKQLEVYSYIIENKFKVNVSKMHIYYTGEESGSPWISFENNRAHIDDTIRSFNCVVSKIQSKEFNSKADKTLICQNCDFRYYCGKN